MAVSRKSLEEHYADAYDDALLSILLHMDGAKRCNVAPDEYRTEQAYKLLVMMFTRTMVDLSKISGIPPDRLARIKFQEFTRHYWEQISAAERQSTK